MAKAAWELELLDRLLFQPKEIDELVLEDHRLISAYAGEIALTDLEWNRILNSPLTLRRAVLLIRKARLANDLGWGQSVGRRLAADTGGELQVLRTNDRYWSLHFLRDEDGWLAVVKLDASAPFASRVLGEQPRIEVVMGDGAPFLSGVLDSALELEGEWSFAQGPAERLQSSGGIFEVRLS